MSITEPFSKAFAKSMFRAGYILAIVLVWQVSIPPLMGQFGSNLQYFSQVGVNGSSTKSFVISHLSATQTIIVDAQLYLHDGTSRWLDGQVELGPGATETLSFGDPKAALTSGWAELKSDGAFIATEFFQLSIGGQLKPRVGVLPSVASSEIRFLGPRQPAVQVRSSGQQPKLYGGIGNHHSGPRIKPVRNLSPKKHSRWHHFTPKRDS